jgi:hypothetical protein
MELIEENSTQLKETIKEIEKDIIESDELSGEEGVSTKSIQKPKKPRSDKQKEALRKAQEARKLKTLKKKELDEAYKEDSEYFKKLTPQQRNMLKKMATEIPMVEGVEKDKVYPSKSRGRKENVVYEDDPSSDEEVVVIKKKKPKTKKKKKIVYESPSDSSDSEEEEKIVKQIQKPKTTSPSQTIEDEYDEPEFSYSYQQPLTYSNIARFL